MVISCNPEVHSSVGRWRWQEGGEDASVQELLSGLQQLLAGRPASDLTFPFSPCRFGLLGGFSMLLKHVKRLKMKLCCWRDHSSVGA